MYVVIAISWGWLLYANLSGSDFADDHPNVQVIGTDISPIQPGWIPPNLKL